MFKQLENVGVSFVPIGSPIDSSASSGQNSMSNIAAVLLFVFSFEAYHNNELAGLSI